MNGDGSSETVSQGDWRETPDCFKADEWAARFFEWRTARNIIGSPADQPEDRALTNLLKQAYARGRADVLAGQLNAVERLLHPKGRCIKCGRAIPAGDRSNQTGKCEDCGGFYSTHPRTFVGP